MTDLVSRRPTDTHWIRAVEAYQNAAPDLLSAAEDNAGLRARLRAAEEALLIAKRIIMPNNVYMIDNPEHVAFIAALDASTPEKK